ncbi:fibronectin type III domain-containing protein [Chryseolinea soli]|nr:fibronectin type III domain-containing protein [Chryseolinea soli]
MGLVTALPSWSQVFPVQSTTQLIPPYSVYLSDYAEPGNEKLRVILVQHDLTQPSYALRLVMSVELNGQLILRTARTFNPPPIHLNAGIPTVISGADLSPYLDSRNIDFIGYNRAEYERTRALPEGSYQITFTAYDYRRQDVQVSNAGTSFYYLAKSEPPLVNYPSCGSAIPLRTPQQVIFSWLARNTSSPNSAGNTQYEFALYETRPPGRNPNDVVLSTPPVFKTTTELTQLIYGPGEPMLLDGMTYVWRVRAIDPKGTDSFRNNGYSEACTFTYGGVNPDINIGVIKNLQAQGETEHRAKIWWEKAGVDAYRVHYRKSSGEWEWFYSDVTTESLTASTEGFIKLFDLEAEVEYETRIQAKKDGFFGPYSDVVKFKMPPRRIAHCGEENNTTTADQSRPLLSAIPNMAIDVDGIDMMLTVVEPLGNGWFKGVGEVTIPYLGGAYGVKFDKLFIDADRIAGNGRVDFITRGVALMLQQQAQNQKKNEQEKVQQQNRAAWNGTDFYEKIFQYDALDIETITVDNASYINITDAQGNVTANAELMQVLNSAPTKAIIIEDKKGDQWVVQKDKATGQTKVMKVEGGGLGSNAMVSGEALDILKKALKALRQTYSDAAINDLKENIDALNKDLQTAIQKHNDQIVTNLTASGQPDGPSIFSKYDLLEAKDASENSAFENQSAVLKDKELEFNEATLIQFVARDLDTKDDYKMIGHELRIDNQSVSDYAAAQKAQNTPESQITDKVKTEIVALLRQIFITYSNSQK